MSESADAVVLVIDDEEKIRKLLRAALTARGYRVEEAATAREARIAVSHTPPDVVILDLGLPDGDGLELTREIRGWSEIPIVVLSARGGESDKVAALEAGADDYMTKPFGVGELVARIGVALRHARRTDHGDARAPFESGRLRVDFERRLVFAGGAEVKLTPTEFRLLALLVKHAGKVLTHTQMLKEVWGPPYVGETQYLRVYMGQLRRKIESDPAQPRLLLTEPGIGYRLASE